MAYTNVFSVKPSAYGVGKKVRSLYDNKTISSIGSAINQGVNAASPQLQPAQTALKLATNLPKYASKVSSAAQNVYSGFTGQPQQTVSTYKPQIQGSGMGSQYISNAGNYVAPPASPAKTPVVDAPKTTSTSASQNYLGSVQTAADRQRTFAEEQRKKQEEYLRQQAALSNRQLADALPAAQQQFGQFKANTEASIADLLAGGERQKSQASDYYGEAQRLAAQTLRETQGKTQATFSGLGTLDSRGEGSFAQANENQMSEFNRNTQQLLKAKADKLSEIDATVSAAERSARATITQEEAKMNELARNIQYAMANNDLQLARDLTDAYNTSQQYIYDIEDALTETKYQFALESQKLTDSLSSVENLSQQFLTTGTPTTKEDIAFIIKNPEGASAFGKLFGGGKTKSASALQVEGKAGAGLRALDTIETEILNNPNILAQAAIPGSPGARQYEAAVSSITDAIGGLRTGASVSPAQQVFYRNLLPKMGDSQETINYKLQALRQELGGYQQGAGQMGTDLPPELMSILGL